MCRIENQEKKTERERDTSKKAPTLIHTMRTIQNTWPPKNFWIDKKRMINGLEEREEKNHQVHRVNHSELFLSSSVSLRQFLDFWSSILDVSFPYIPWYTMFNVCSAFSFKFNLINSQFPHFNRFKMIMMAHSYTHIYIYIISNVNNFAWATRLKSNIE